MQFESAIGQVGDFGEVYMAMGGENTHVHATSDDEGEQCNDGAHLFHELVRAAPVIW